MADILSFVTTLIQNAGAFGVFAGSVIEEVFSFIPSAVVQVSAGFFLLQGQPMTLATFGTLFLSIGIPAALGVALGSIPYYAAGRWGGQWFVRRWGKYIGVSESKLETVRAQLQDKKQDEVFFMIGRMIPLVPSVILTFAAGVVRMRIIPFILLSIIGTFVRASILAFVGWQFGVLATGAVDRFDTIATAVGTLLVVGIGSWWVIKKFKK
jgi:membrane protein DedA with SNARE-associated domain